MDLLAIVLTVSGLVIFETVSSIDNAIINAEVLSTMGTSGSWSEEKLLESGKSALSDVSKIFYLEVIDATFSIDGVIGAFAFTLSVPPILLGNGIGALVVG